MLSGLEIPSPSQAKGVQSPLGIGSFDFSKSPYLLIIGYSF